MVVPLIANFLEQRGDTLVFIEDERGRGVWSFGLSQIERLETSADAGSTHPLQGSGTGGIRPRPRCAVRAAAATRPT
jgi:hypothetical protein